MPKLSIGIVSLLLLFSCVGGVETSDADNQLELGGDAGDTVVASGEFEGFGHIGQGSAQVIEVESGESLSLQDFRTTCQDSIEMSPL